MINKKDFILWFKELESYKRIDTMCTLLNMCLPFELRFLGTCLEELGRRDSQELRGMELRVNNPTDLASDMIACQKGEPTDRKIRRMMALYLALMRAFNRSCVADIFRTLDSWGERDFLGMTDLDTLQELLLVYMMAANHPVFSFEQHMRCIEIFERIKENKLVADPMPTMNAQQQQQQAHIEHSVSHGPHQPDMRQHLPPTHQEMLQQHALHAMHISGQHPQLLTAPPPIQVLPQGTIPMNFPQAHLTKTIPSDGNMQHQITVDGIPHMIASNISIPAEPTIISHPNAAWTYRPYPPPAATIEHPPQSSSPLLSQQSSPSSSRTTSPNRTPNTNIMQQGMQTQQQQVRNMQQRMNNSMKNVRRPSSETTPPPINQQQQQQQQQQHQQMMSSDIILPQNMKHIDDGVNSDNSGNQLQNLIRNGFTRAAHHPRLKAGNFIAPHPQPPTNQHFHAISSGNYALPYAIQNMAISETTVLEENVLGKSGGSDSGSSIGSSGEVSPPITPTLMSNQTNRPDQQQQQQQQQQQPQQKHHQQQVNFPKQLTLSRHNGRPDKILPASGVGSSTGTTVIYAPTNAITHTHQQQQQSQSIFGSDIILGPGGNSSSANVMQSSLTNNNNAAGASIVPSSTNPPSSNNNMVANAVLISSPSAVGGGIIGNAITTNSGIILQSHQQQFNASYPYHAAAAAVAAQHISGRPPLITHNPGMAPHGTFRLPSFQIPNGELLYPAYHPTGITFLSSGGPPGAPTVALRPANPGSVSTNTPPQLQPQQQPPPPTLQPTGTNTAMLAPSPYTALTIGINKPVSCYNCGSQTHNGRDCQEASMDDVTRSANYKLDYSISVSTSNVSPTTTANASTSTIGGASGSNSRDVASDTLQLTHHQKQHAMESIPTATVSTSTSTTSLNQQQTQQSATTAGINTKKQNKKHLLSRKHREIVNEPKHRGTTN
ncbi:probable serine/threonine-protein kinase DDB_G0267686 isoform X2 [Teleopsis dalmanni]|uniref:probable serine/threonine-protein kinase DDB_G0267686 isoform X2 n=1 Tax=Teleopsis dalmanni TaxID=139649 RepID=UPI0018CF43AE|nr:probable serine/threonine-protein kinase DDB_G0267686 isoform X2 [Teleopsis dalmanni]